MMMAPSIRPATADDLKAIDDIYNHYVTRSTCTYQLTVDPFSEREAWFAAHGPRHPITVATDGARVVGWASLSPHRARAAYARTVESSVYIHHEAHRRGLGRALMVDLLARGEALGHHAVLAGVDSEQSGSLRLHEALGFRRVGTFEEVGFKFDRWLHVVYLEKLLGGGAGAP